MKTHYDVLGVSMNATLEEIKKIYRKECQKWHPDHHMDNPSFLPRAEARTKELNEAYNVLSDLNKRRDYDRKIHIKPKSEWKESSRTKPDRDKAKRDEQYKREQQEKAKQDEQYKREQQEKAKQDEQYKREQQNRDKAKREERYKREQEDKEKVKKEWATKLEEMKKVYNDVKAYVDNIDIDSSIKLTVWQRFIDSFKENNPYSNEDNIMRAEAFNQLNYWKNHKSETKPSSTAKSLTIIGNDGATMTIIPAGEFVMGDNDFNDAKVHKVYIDAFYMDVYEVTNAQYKKFMDAGHHYGSKYWYDSNYNAPNHPVVGISWNDAVAYAEWAGKRLPTEAEWEKAARGGFVGQKYPWGDAITHDDANYSGTGGKDVWDMASPVGSFAPNGYGLYDMVGNVCEWCADWYNGSYYTNPPKQNPKGPHSGQWRVLRGGSWSLINVNDLNVANRDFNNPQYEDINVGFRCVMDVLIDDPIKKQTYDQEIHSEPKADRQSEWNESSRTQQDNDKIKKEWTTKLEKMKKAYNDVKANENSNADPSIKATVWQRFIDSFKEDNPYTHEDNIMRTEAFNRLNYYRSQTSGTKQSTIVGNDGVKMVLIPTGDFQMGSNNGSDKEKPIHTVYLDAFYMDVYEVTNAQYKKFMDSTGHKAPEYWNDSRFNAPNHPVVDVSWSDAVAYCKWAGKRLPTEAQWEKAARGGLIDKQYPWGDNLTYDYANYSGTGGKDKWEYTSPVGVLLQMVMVYMTW
jgi:formylglycine-generating enzyme